jgi:CheY-like chemotaxis protein
MEPYTGHIYLRNKIAMGVLIMSQILVVDDDPDAREILSLILGTLDIAVVQAQNGFDALAAVGKELPLLIILDLSMPHLDGEAVLTKLRESPDTSSVPVIIFTAKTLSNDELVRLDVPLHMIIRKGRLSMTHLRDLVMDILHSKAGLTFENI